MSLTQLSLAGNAFNSSFDFFASIPNIQFIDRNIPLSSYPALFFDVRLAESLVAFHQILVSNNDWNGQNPSPLPETLPYSLNTLVAVSCTLTGVIPAAYANHTQLQVLVLRNNLLTTPLPPFRTLLLLDGIPLLLLLHTFSVLFTHFRRGCLVSLNPFNVSLATALAPLWDPNPSQTSFPFEDSSLPFAGPQVALQLLDMSECGLTGTLPYSMWNPTSGNDLISRLPLVVRL